MIGIDVLQNLCLFTTLIAVYGSHLTITFSNRFVVSSFVVDLHITVTVEPISTTGWTLWHTPD